MSAIRDCLGQACAAAGLDPESVDFASACLGFSGGPDDKESILRELIAADRMTVTHDAWIALSGALAGEPGIAVIAGTGSIAFGRNSENRTARAGGWGYVFGDEGGGFDLARHALRAALRYEEGWGPPTALHASLLAAASARNANELLHRFYTPEFPRAVIASYSRLVDEAALQGDAVAQKLLTQAAQELALLGQAVYGQLFGPKGSASVAYIGGVFRSRTLLTRFRSLVELNQQVRVAQPVYGPGAGALIEAYRAAGCPCRLSDVPEIEK